MTAPARRMLTVEEAADYCGFKSADGFRAYIRIPPVKFGKSVRYDRAALDDYLDRLRAPSPRGRPSERVGNASADRGRSAH